MKYKYITLLEAEKITKTPQKTLKQRCVAYTKNKNCGMRCKKVGVGFRSLWLVSVEEIDKYYKKNESNDL